MSKYVMTFSGIAEKRIYSNVYMEVLDENPSFCGTSTYTPLVNFRFFLPLTLD